MKSKFEFIVPNSNPFQSGLTSKKVEVCGGSDRGSDGQWGGRSRWSWDGSSSCSCGCSRHRSRSAGGLSLGGSFTSSSRSCCVMEPKIQKPPQQSRPHQGGKEQRRKNNSRWLWNTAKQFSGKSANEEQKRGNKMVLCWKPRSGFLLCGGGRRRSPPAKRSATKQQQRVRQSSSGRRTTDTEMMNGCRVKRGMRNGFEHFIGSRDLTHLFQSCHHRWAPS